MGVTRSEATKAAQVAQKEHIKVPLSRLPSELIGKIFDYTDFHDLLNLFFVCKRLRSYIEDDTNSSHKLFRLTLTEKAMTKESKKKWLRDLCRTGYTLREP